MNAKKLMSLLLAMVMILLLSAGCTEPQQAAKTFTEGADTVCEITGYSAYKGAFASSFLQEGDRIAVISPSALPTQEQTDAVMEGLKKWGYVPVEGKHVCEKERTLEDCISDLEWALEDPSTKAIFCVRGGAAASEVMDQIANEMIFSSGKLIIGYSDITVYLSAWTASGLPSVHACMSGAFMDQLTEECIQAEQKILQGGIPSYRCACNAYCRTGKAEGILIGGNLSTILTTLGTDYDCTKTEEPYILFLEDVDEDLEHIHRYLTVLKHLGVLDRAAGIVFGEWADVPSVAETYQGSSRGGPFTSVADMISREFLQDAEIPVAFGFPAGHTEEHYPLLMGEKVLLDVSESSYTLSWN